MTPRKLGTKEALRPRGQAPDPGPTTLAIDGGLEARRISVGTSKALGATTETWVVHKRGEPGASVLQVDIFKPRGRLWAAWTGNFTRADKRELAERVAAARNGTGVSEARRYPKPSPPPRRFVSPRAKEGHRVADFNTLDALLRHERDENGAKYTYRSPGSVRIYYPDGKGFKEGVAWKEQGYWHAQAPSERVSVSKPPQGSEAIVGKSLTEARRGAAPSAAHRRTARGAEARGEQYANDQINGDYFMDWVRSQLAEAARMPPEDVLPLETKSDARVIAKNMLQDLEWDAKRDLQEDDAFWRGFRKALDGSREWLADELLSTKNGDQIFKKARVEAPRTKTTKYKPAKTWKLRVVDRIVPDAGAQRVEFKDGFSIQVHGGSGRGDQLYAMRPYDMRLEQRSPGPESRREYQYAALVAVLNGRPATFLIDSDGDVRATDIPLGTSEARRAPKAKRSAPRRR